jgi:hypothetical protein
MLIDILQAIVVGLLDKFQLSIESSADRRVLEKFHRIGQRRQLYHVVLRHFRPVPDEGDRSGKG